jgi:hypothetical protein
MRIEEESSKEKEFALGRGSFSWKASETFKNSTVPT